MRCKLLDSISTQRPFHLALVLTRIKFGVSLLLQLTTEDIQLIIEEGKIWNLALIKLSKPQKCYFLLW